MTYSLFRTMRADTDGLPLLGRARDRLGVVIAGERPDVIVQDDGTILPKSGGMSAFIDPRKMPKPLRPRSLLEKPGESAHPIFILSEEMLLGALCFRRGTDKGFHGVVEPREQCALDKYEDEIGATRPHWKVAYAGEQ
jgi:hypothetical protein